MHTGSSRGTTQVPDIRNAEGDAVIADTDDWDYQEAEVGVTTAVHQPSAGSRKDGNMPQQGSQQQLVPGHPASQVLIQSQAVEGRERGGNVQSAQLEGELERQSLEDQQVMFSGLTQSNQEAEAAAEENMPWILLTLGKALRMVQGELQIPADEDARHTSRS
jgi:hypothetical protein